MIAVRVYTSFYIVSKMIKATVHSQGLPLSPLNKHWEIMYRNKLMVINWWRSKWIGLHGMNDN